MDHDGSGVKAIETRTLFILDLKQLEQTCFFARCRHDPQIAVFIDEEDARGIGGEEFDASGCERRERVDEVEVGDELAGELDERGRREEFAVAVVCDVGHQLIPVPGSGPSWVNRRRRCTPSAATSRVSAPT